MVLEKGRAKTDKREEKIKEEEEEEEEKRKEERRKRKEKITGMELLNLSMEFEYGYMSWVVWNYKYVYVNYGCMEI